MKSGDGNARSVKNGLTVGEYAMVHEMGSLSRQIPARPLWFPAFAKIEGGSKMGKGGLGQRMQGAIGKRLNKMGIPIRLAR